MSQPSETASSLHRPGTDSDDVFDDDDGHFGQRVIASDYGVFNLDIAESPYRDDITGQPLDPALVREARKKELEYFESKHVWRKATLAECRRVMGRAPISVRWVDVNKGDNANPNVRSRLVARQIRGPGEESTFAPTPPLETLRTIISMAATDLPGRPACCRDPDSEDRMQISSAQVTCVSR